jgi:uroporphyrinogen-III synthase
VRRPLVLNTRPREQAPELSSLLRAAGFDVAEAPAIAIVPAWDESTRQSLSFDLQRHAFDWVVLPSQNAAQGLERDLGAYGERVVCGAATAAALGLDKARVLDRFSAAAALEALRPLVKPGQRVLVPRAAEGREELLDGLREQGVDVAAPIAYRTLPVGDASARLRLDHVDVVVLCSPSAITSVVADVPSDTLIVCLGQTTAAAARTHGLRVDAVAERSTMTALVEAVQAAVGARV